MVLADQQHNTRTVLWYEDKYVPYPITNHFVLANPLITDIIRSDTGSETYRLSNGFTPLGKRGRTPFPHPMQLNHEQRQTKPVVDHMHDKSTRVFNIIIIISSSNFRAAVDLNVPHLNCRPFMTVKNESIRHDTITVIRLAGTVAQLRDWVQGLLPGNTRKNMYIYSNQNGNQPCQKKPSSAG